MTTSSRPIRLLLLALLLAAAPHLCARAAGRLAIQPLGPVDAALVEKLAASLRATFDMDVEVLEAVPLPQEAYYKPRARYRAAKLLDALDRMEPARYDRVLGITASDISTTKGEHEDWGIFGLACLSARPCVVSTFRLKRKATPALLLLRLLKVARHEVGHTLGLAHCETPGCVMQDAKGSIKPVDESDGTFCTRCAAMLAPALRKNGVIGKAP